MWALDAQEDVAVLRGGAHDVDVSSVFVRGEVAVKITITAIVAGDDPTEEPMWGYHHEEIIAMTRAETPEQVHDVMLGIGQNLLDGIDQAKESVGRQIRAASSNWGAR